MEAPAAFAVRTISTTAVEWPESPVAGRVLVVSLLVTLVVGLVVGLLPALQSAKADLVNALKAGTREGGGRMSRVRGALTIAQAALSVMLLIGAGLFVRSLHQIDTLDLGIQRTAPAVDPMRLDRLTVILTGPLD